MIKTKETVGVYKKPKWFTLGQICIWSLLVAASLYLAMSTFLATMFRNDDFVETFYITQSKKIVSNVRTVVIADLHLKEYGKGNSELLARVEALKPDFITIAGDMFLYKSGIYEPVYDLCKKLCEIAPTYFGMGNHELSVILNENVDLKKALIDTGVTLVHNSYVKVNVNGNDLVIGGLSQSGAGIAKYAPKFISGFTAQEGYKLLITHYPKNFDGYIEYEDIDLAICGHEHGGIVRLPVIGALYSEDQGLFPDYTEGLMQIGSVPVVISRGLGDSSKVPRINNPPELVIVDIIPYCTEFSY